MKIVFFGTPDYVVPILDKIHKAFRHKSEKSSIIAVVTQKPKPSGRKKSLEYTAVDSWAHKKRLPIFYNSTDIIKKNIKADIGVLAAFGEILSKKVINHFPNGVLNIHPSLLPKYRGASPVQAAILMGEKQTGVTITKMDEELDKGKKISQFTKDIFDNDTTNTLRRRLFKDAAEVLVTLLPAYREGKIKMEILNHETGTFTSLIKKEYGFIPPKFLEKALNGKQVNKKWNIPFIKNCSIGPTAEVIERFVRAMQPWPIAWTKVKVKGERQEVKVKRLKILKAHIEERSNVKGQRLNINLVLDQVQLEGKNSVSWTQFTQGYPEAFLK